MEISLDKYKKVLEDNDSTASACMLALDAGLGDGWEVWEPETVWLELSRRGISVPNGNRDQILAARSLIINGRFFTDALVFEKTIVAFNNEEINADSLEDAPVAYLDWGVYEAKLLYEDFVGETTVSFDREPVGYTAVQLYNEGFVLAPDHLTFAQDALDKLYPKETSDLKKQVKKLWADFPRNGLEDVDFPETELGVQLAKLASVYVYVEQHKSRRRRDLAELTG